MNQKAFVVVSGMWTEKFLTVGVTSTGRFVVGRRWRHSAAAGAAGGQCKSQLLCDFGVIGLVNVVEYAASCHFHLECKSQPWSRALSLKTVYFNSFNLLRIRAIEKGFSELAKTIKSNEIGCMQVTEPFRYLFRTLSSPIWICFCFSRPRRKRALSGTWELTRITPPNRQHLHTKSLKCLLRQKPDSVLSSSRRQTI